MKSADLIRMANQITAFFEVYPKSEALERHPQAHPQYVGAPDAQ